MSPHTKCICQLNSLEEHDGNTNPNSECPFCNPHRGNEFVFHDDNSPATRDSDHCLECRWDMEYGSYPLEAQVSIFLIQLLVFDLLLICDCLLTLSLVCAQRFASSVLGVCKLIGTRLWGSGSRGTR